MSKILVFLFLFVLFNASESTIIYQKLWYVGYTDSVGKYQPYSTIKVAYSYVLPQFISSVTDCDGLGDESVKLYRELNDQTNTVTLEYKYFPNGGIEKYKNFLYYITNANGLNYIDKDIYFIAYDITHETLFQQVDNANVKQGILSTYKILFFDCGEDASNYLEFLKTENSDLKYVFYDSAQETHESNENSLTNSDDVKAVKLLNVNIKS